MYRHNRSERNKKALYAKVFILVLLLLVFILSRAALGVYSKSKNAKANLIETTEDLNNLEERSLLLEEDINKLNTERGVDEEIREKFRVAKEGEGMIMLIDSPSTTEENNDFKEKSIWSRFFNIF